MIIKDPELLHPYYIIVQYSDYVVMKEGSEKVVLKTDSFDKALIDVGKRRMAESSETLDTLADYYKYMDILDNKIGEAFSNYTRRGKNSNTGG